MSKSNVVTLPSTNETTLKERIAKYTQVWIDTGDKRTAYEAAGYSDARGSNAYVFHKQHHEAITKEAAMYLSGSVPLALKTLNDIMLNGKSETAKTKCALEILDRAGLDKTTKIQLNGEEAKSQEELKEQLQALLRNNPEIGLIEEDVQDG